MTTAVLGSVALLLVLLLAGVVLNLIGAPGTVLMAVAVLAFGWLTEWHVFGLWSLLLIFILAVAAEALEFLGGLAGAKAGGASPRGVRWALGGALLGALLMVLTFNPLPVLLGLLGGAVLGEHKEHGDWRRALKSALGVLAGKAAGIVAKTGIALLILLYCVVQLALSLPWAELR